MEIFLLLLSFLFATDYLPSEFSEQLKCMKTAIYYEAGNQDIIGKFAVGQVIKNRVEHKEWKTTYCEVIHQPAQFSYYWDGLPEHLPRKNNRFERTALKESYWIALALLTLPIPDFTDGSLYYHGTYIKPPGWTKKLKKSMTTGDHILYASLDTD